MLILRAFIRSLVATTFIASLLIATSFTPISMMNSVYANPPGWSSSHGHKDKKYSKHKKYSKYKKYSGHKKSKPHYGDDSGAANIYMPTHTENKKCARTRENVGNVIGGVVGGIAGHQVGGGDGKKLATIAGAIAGWFVGGGIGKSMDEADRYCTGQALSNAPDGSTVEWRNPDEDIDYKVTPIKTIKSENSYCREYTTEATIGGKKQKAYGTACRQPDGSWKIKS